jgi:ketosteroid isomerase-like protein
MRKIFFLTAMLALASLLSGCDPGAANNAGNKPANAANNSANIAKPAADSAAIETEIKKAVSDMAATLQKNDAAAMEKLYTDNYMFVGPDGSTVTAAQRVASMKSGDTKYDSITYDEVSVRSNPEGNGAISISRATVKGKNLGKAVDGQYRVTHVWSKTKDGWRLASGQTTAITAAAAPASNSASNSNAAAEPKTSNSNSNK